MRTSNPFKCSNGPRIDQSRNRNQRWRDQAFLVFATDSNYKLAMLERINKEEIRGTDFIGQDDDCRQA
jgi:hypothetical protein